MHLIVKSEGYEADLKILKNRLENKCYRITNPVDGKEIFVRPAVRKIETWDIVIQKEAIDEILSDLNACWTEKVYDNWFIRLFDAFLNRFKPAGIQGVPRGTTRTDKKGNPVNQRVDNILYNGLNNRVKVLPIATRADPVNEYNFEVV